MLKDNKTLFIEGYDPNKNIMRKLSVCKSSVKNWVGSIPRSSGRKGEQSWRMSIIFYN